jgi:predicted Fe-Mo cluster-binding NifX family protein
MKVAVTVWEGTVSTVCDFSSRLLVFDVMGDEVQNRSFMPFETGILPERVNQLGELGVEVLLCGAISRPLERMIRASGVKVIPCLRGSIEEVIGAYLDGGLSDARFTLPGFGPGASRARGGKRWRGGGFCRLPDKVKGDDGRGRD